MNGPGDSRRKKDDSHMIKAVKCCSREMESTSASATEHDVLQVI